MNIEDSGKIYAIGLQLQTEINELDKRKNVLLNLVKRVIQLQTLVPVDEFGDALPESEIQKRIQRLHSEFNKCMSSDSKATESEK